MNENEIQNLINQALEKAYDYFKKQDYQNADELYRQILRINPDNVLALQMGALTTNKNGNTEDAKQMLETAIQLDPTDWRNHNNMGLVLAGEKNHHQAIYHFQKALDITSKETFLYGNLALEYRNIGERRTADEIFLKGLEKNPNCHNLLFNYGAFVHEYGELDKAIYYYEAALKIENNFPMCHYNLSSCYFLKGDYKRAWPEYEWRWDCFPFGAVKKRFTQPYWKGEKCNHLFLYTEQGIGDTLMFLRFIPSIRDRAKRITLEVHPQLRNLLQDFPSVDEITSTPPESLDYHCSLISVPSILETTPDIIPPAISLKNKKQASVWEKYREHFKVGVAWCGNPLHPNDLNRSCSVRYFKEISEMEGIKLFSLQKEILKRSNGIDLAMGAEDMKIVDMREHITDWEDTAAIIQNLDLVITVDTSVAHLAAACGKPVWLLIANVPDWRWGTKGRITPWYHNVILFRQHAKNDWNSVFEEVKNELELWLRWHFEED